MAVELATGYVRLMPSARGFQQAINKEIGPDLVRAGEQAGDDTSRAFGGRFSSGMRTAAKAAAVGFAGAFAGAAVIGKQAVDAASDLQEAVSKTSAVFDDGAADVEAWAKTAATAFGQSTRQALEAAGTFGNLFQSFGVNQRPAREMSQSLVQLASDLASFNNTSVDEALTALQSGVSGETEPLKRYGIAINEARLQAEAMRLGLVETTVDQNKLSQANERVEKAQRAAAKAMKDHGKDSVQYRDAVRDVEQAEAGLTDVMAGSNVVLDQAQKSQAAYSLITQDSALAQGDFARTSDGLANSQRTMSAQFENAKAALGQGLLPIVTKFVSFIASNLPKVVDSVKMFGNAFSAAFSGDGVTSDGAVGVFERLGVAARAVVDWFKANWPTIRDVVVWVLDKVRAAIGYVIFDLIPKIIDRARTLKDAFVGAFSGDGVTSDGFVGVVERIGVVARELVEWFKRNWPQIRDTVVDVFEGVRTAVAVLVDEVIPAVLDAFNTAYDWVRENWPKIKDTVMGVFNSIRDAWFAVGQPVVDAIVTAWRAVVDFFTSEQFAGIWQQIQEIWDGVLATVRGALAVLEGIVRAAVATIGFIWDNFGNEIVDVIRSVWEFVQRIVKAGIEVVHGIIKAVTSLIRGDWGAAWDAIKQVVSGVWDGIKAVVKLGLDNLKNIISAGFSAIKAAFEAPAEALWHFMRDRVITPITDAVGTMRDTLARVFGEAVDKVKTAWSGIRAVYDFVVDNVVTPVSRAVRTVRDAVIDAFQAAVDGVKLAWDTLKNIVKAPINVVIGFYNNGIRRVWNSVISKIPGVGDLGEIATLNKGGWVPGSGNRDTVPALLTPGEFVVTKKAAQALGPGLLAAMNNPRGTLDPGIFGYATGGYVRSADEALAFARQQAGKRYQFPDVGPDTFDCSGFTSALINYIMGVNPPWRRRHSSGSIGSDPALARGGGEPNGFAIGARPPYMTNAQGSRVGHVAATLMGVNMEATPPAVRVGGGARGAFNSMFTGLFHLPGYGGLSSEDKAIATSVAGLGGLQLSGMKAPLGDLLQTLFNRLPGMVLDFFTKKLPSLIVDAVRDIFTADVHGSVAFANGGTVGRNGPILVGERGPEWMWGSRGDYVQANHDLPGGGRSIVINNNHAPFDLDRAVRQARLMVA